MQTLMYIWLYVCTTKGWLSQRDYNKLINQLYKQFNAAEANCVQRPKLTELGKMGKHAIH